MAHLPDVPEPPRGVGVITWFKVDDSFYRSRKVRKLGRQRVAAVGLWTLCGGWSADNLTDGFVPWEVVEDWDSKRSLAAQLIAAGLWDEDEYDGEQGVRFHDWSDWQPTKEQVTQRRKADAERRARWRDARRAAGRTPPPGAPSPPESQPESPPESRRDTPVASQQESRPGSVLPDPTRPDPTRPVLSYGENDEGPTAARARRRSPATPLPDTWRPTDSHERQAHETGLDVRYEAQQFRNHAEANDRRQASWDAAFRQWLGKSAELRRNRPPLRAVSGGHQPFRNPADQSVYDEPLLPTPGRTP